MRIKLWVREAGGEYNLTRGSTFLISTFYSSSTEPDAVETVWEPPEEGPHDTDPIIRCRWAPVVVVINGMDNLGKDRRSLLRRAMALLAAHL